ncbi:MAG: acetoin utilization protein AcuC [Saprospiraceae bacterium]|jgi:acetoin utilization protein AcuC
MNASTVALYLSPALGAYGFGNNHPFGTDRMDAFFKETLKQGIDKQVAILSPNTCDEADLKRFHTDDYVERVKRQSQTGCGFLDGGDTPAFKGVFDAASTVVGAGLDGLKLMMDGQCNKIFVPIAGLHHASRESAAGFCVFNDAGVLIETLRAQYDVKKVAYIDIDAHHGDGVFYAFETDPNMIFADIHEDGRFLYPGTGDASETGKGAAVGTKLNIPLAPGSDDQAFYQAWGEVEAFVEAGKPEVIILQAGADSVKGDPITHLAFTPEAHGYAAKRLSLLADKYCNGRMIALGGGGYNRTNLALAWNRVVKAML